MSEVENSIDSQSNTRTSTSHRIRLVHSVVVQGYNEATGVAVPVSSSSVGVCFVSGLPLSTMASVRLSVYITRRTGYVPPYGQVGVPQSSYHSILCILLSFTQQLPQLSHQFMVLQHTLSTLCHSADIQAQVNVRLQELEQVHQINTAGTGDSSVIAQNLSKK